MAISSGTHPQAALAKATHLLRPLAKRPAAPALEAAPPGTHSGFRPWPGTWPLPHPQGVTFTAFLFFSFFKIDRRLVQLTGFLPVGS